MFLDQTYDPDYWSKFRTEYILVPGFINYTYTIMDIKANMYMVKDVQRIRATYTLLAMFYF